MKRSVTRLRVAIFSLALLLPTLLLGCNSDDVAEVTDNLDDVLDVADGVPRKNIDRSRLGINAFAPDARFGFPAEQFNEVRSTLGIRWIRLLFNWNSGVQPTPEAPLNLSFYDELIAALPSDCRAIIVLADLPDWMSSSTNWVGRNPRRTFAEKFVRPIAEAYGSNPKVEGFQVWNEPNMLANPDNILLDVANSPESYVEMLAYSENVIRDAAPGKRVILAATTAINQRFPDTLNYNRAMLSAGADQLVDVWAIHYYGSQYENVVRSKGVRSFVNDLGLPVWVTESGAQGVNEQLEYGERTWPFLLEEMPAIERIYIYQFAEPTPPETTYGLRNLSSGTPVSDLYVWLRDG